MEATDLADNTITGIMTGMGIITTGIITGTITVITDIITEGITGIITGMGVITGITGVRRRGGALYLQSIRITTASPIIISPSLLVNQR